MVSRKVAEAVQPVAWLLGEYSSLPDTLRKVQVLRLPPPIRGTISCAEIEIPRLPPIASLHDALASFSHVIAAFDAEVFRSEEPSPRWLYARADQQLNVGRLKTLIIAWLLTTHNDSRRSERTVADWGQIDWSWGVLDLEAAPLQLKRMLLPALVARSLLDQGYQLPLDSAAGTVMLPLRLVPLMTQRYIAELISDPLSSGADQYSIVLRFWVEPMPGFETLWLYCRPSVRRWEGRPLIEGNNVFLKRGRSRSVYLRRSTGYVDDTAITDVFCRLTMKHLGGGPNNLRWVGNQAKVFRALDLKGDFPEAVELAVHPEQYRDDMLIVLESRQSQTHEVSTGLWSNDHRRIADSLSEQLGTWVTSMPIWPRVPAGDAVHGHRSLTQSGLSKASAEARRRAFLAMPGPVQIEIHMDKFKQATDVILTELGMDDCSAEPHLESESLQFMHNGESILTITHGTDPNLTGLLPPDIARPVDYYAATRKRRHEIGQMYTDAERPTGALISLHGYHTSKATRNRDPKRSIRLGLIDTGRVSQFIIPDKSSYEYRLKSAIRDLLRVLGFRLNPFYVKPEGTTLPDELDILAFWIIQLNSRNKAEQTVTLPLLVDAPFGVQHLRVWMPSRSGSATLHGTLREAIMAAAAYDLDYEDEDEIIRFFRDAMSRRQAQGSALLLLVDQNLRRIFPELREQNPAPHINLYNILPEGGPVRVARLRFSAQNEAAFCCPATPRSKYQGLYHNAGFPLVYFSLHNVGNRKVRKDARKLDNPDVPAVNPSTVQIWLNNLQKDDKPAEWAALVHRLRRESSHYEPATLLPQPLHDIRCLGDYLLNLADETTEDDLNAIQLPLV